MTLEGILITAIVLSILLLIVSTRKDEEDKFQDWLNMYFIEKDVDTKLLRNIYMFEKDPDKALAIHNNYKEDVVDEECTHPERYREYYSSNTYKCWECGKIRNKDEINELIQ